MKYPKPWEAGMPAGRPYVSSSREGPHAGQIQLGTYVNRAGTPDHSRLIRTWLTVEQAKQMAAELTYHVEMMQRREVGIVEQMINNGSIGTGPYRNPEDDDCREAQDNTPSKGPF